MKRTHAIIRRVAGLALMVSLLSLIVSVVRTTATSSLPVKPVSRLEADSVEKDGMAATLAEMPLQFVENRGQVDGPVAFYVQGRDKTIYFTPAGVTFALTSQIVEPSRELNRTDLFSTNDLAVPAARPGRRNRWAVKLEFVNRNPHVRLKGQDPTGASTNYFQGSKGQWRTSLASYQTLTYENLWPGVDLVYSGDGNRIKYQFLVHPGADPKQIRLAYRGASAVSVNAQGQLAVTTPVGDFHDDSPYSYQEIEGQRVEVKTSYSLGAKASAGRHSYSFRLDGYDQSKPLIIDPAIVMYAGYIGGAGEERGLGIAVDRHGNAYVTGATNSSQLSFPVSAGPDPTFAGVQDAFIVKINSTGTGIVYATYLGGTGDDVGFDIALDNEGNAYVTGATSSTEASFPVEQGPDLSYNGGAYDAFVAKLNPAGSELVYCGYLGGAGQEGGGGIAVDGLGNAYLTGATTSSETTFPASMGPDLTYNGGLFFGDAFIAKVKPTGSALEYCGYIGGSGEDAGLSIAIDARGNTYIAGGTTSDQTTFPVAVGPDLTFNGGLRDAFVAKISAGGVSLVYAGYLGGDSGETAFGIAIDSDRNVYVTGDTSSSEISFPVAIGPDLTYNGGGDAFVAKIDWAGTALVYCGYIGGINRDGGLDIRVAAAGQAFVTGATASSETTFPVRVGPDLAFNGGGNDGDAFVARVKANGRALDYCGYVGGSKSDIGYALALDRDGNVYITGETTSTQLTFPTAIGPDLSYNEGARDAFVSRIGAGCNYSISPSSQSFAAGGGTGSISVTSGIGCGWRATTSSSWIVIKAGADGAGNGQVKFSVAGNTSVNPRTGTLILAGQTFTVEQAGVPVNSAPDCRNARPSMAQLWPPNHQWVSVSVLGVTDPDGDRVGIGIVRIMQDELTDTDSDGDHCPDAVISGTSAAKLRAERNGRGNGRVYTIFFTASDDRGGSCQGQLKVGVPHSVNKTWVDDAPAFDSTSCRR